MLTLLRVPLFLVPGERFALALTFVSLRALGALAHIGVRDGAFISSYLRFQIFVSNNPSRTGPSAALKPCFAEYDPEFGDKFAIGIRHRRFLCWSNDCRGLSAVGRLATLPLSAWLAGKADDELGVDNGLSVSCDRKGQAAVKGAISAAEKAPRPFHAPALPGKS
jgi:hypothetical protein